MSSFDMGNKTKFLPICPPMFREQKIMQAAFGWVGGKNFLAKKIVGMMPEHKTYCEVFAGSAKVLYAKPSGRDIIIESIKGRKENLFFNKNIDVGEYKEIINDVNGELINLHKIIQTRPQSLKIELNNMLISRQYFNEIKHKILKPRNNIQRAAFYHYLNTLSFKGNQRSFSEMREGRNGWSPLLYKDFEKFSKRLKGVVIENNSFESIIKNFDSKNTFFYLDPPYFLERMFKRMSDYYHNCDFKEAEHLRLCEMLKNIKGKFILSYNDHERIRELYKDFNIIETEPISYSYGECHKKKVELLILNYRLPTTPPPSFFKNFALNPKPHP